jgi:hypothetical protein
MHMASRLATAVAPSTPTSSERQHLNLYWVKLLNDPVVFQGRRHEQ